MKQCMPFSIQKLSQGVSRILEAHICESWRCNIWNIQGRDRDLFVDTGMGIWPIADHIAAIRERPIPAFCRNSHHDHAGGLFQFINRLGHSAEAEISVNPTRANTVAGLFASSVIKTPPNPAFDASSWCYPSAPLTIEVSEADVIDLGDRVLQTSSNRSFSRMCRTLGSE